MSQDKTLREALDRIRKSICYTSGPSIEGMYGDISQKDFELIETALANKQELTMNTHNACAALLRSCAAIQTHVSKLTAISADSPAEKELWRAAGLVAQGAAILQKLALQSASEHDHKEQQSAETMYLADALNEMLGAYRDVYGRMPWERGE